MTFNTIHEKQRLHITIKTLNIKYYYNILCIFIHTICVGINKKKKYNNKIIILIKLKEKLEVSTRITQNARYDDYLYKQ